MYLGSFKDNRNENMKYFDRAEDKVLLKNTKRDLKVPLILFCGYLYRMFFRIFIRCQTVVKK